MSARTPHVEEDRVFHRECGMCHSVRILAGPWIGVGGDHVERLMECADCRALWTEVKHKDTKVPPMPDLGPGVRMSRERP